MVKTKLDSICLDQKILSHSQCKQVQLWKNAAQSVLMVRGTE